MFVKLNWKAARDSDQWVHNQKCQSIEDLLTAIKASERIADMNTQILGSDDLSDQEIIHRGGLYLVIKRYVAIDSATEFRCFVRDKQLIGICQRVTQHYYEHLASQ